MNINEVRAALSLRRAELNDKYITEKLYKTKSLEDIFENDLTLVALRQTFLKTLKKTKKNER